MNHLFWRLFKLLILMLLFSPVTVFSEELVLDDRALYRYAMYLYRNGEYYRAVTEYKRLIHFFPDSNLATEADLQIGRSYMAGGRPEEAVNYWKARISLTEPGGEVLNRMKILYGISLLDLNRADPYRLRQRNIEKALTVFQEVEPIDKDGRWVRGFVDDWKAALEPELKSPWLAGTLSAVVPGSGSFYSGRRLEGVYAFFLTGLFWLATVDAMNNEDEALAGVFGFFTLAFYGGNIYTAVNSAHKTNDYQFSVNLTNLRQHHGIWFIPETTEQEGRF